VLGGCANFSKDGGMTLVAEQTGSILGMPAVKINTEAEAATAKARVRSLLGAPLTPNAGVQIALLNNRALQAAYNELGVSEAEMIQASLPPAPTITLAHLTGAELEIERQLAQDILALLTLPRRREIAADRFRAAQARAVEATLRTAAEARRAFYRAVAARQTVVFLEQSRASAEASSELAKKLGETGALPKLGQARQHAFYADVAGQLAVARLKERGEREKLNRALGLWGDDLRYRLPDKLPTLPSKPRTAEMVETEAVGSRIDLQIARMDLAVLAKEYGLTRATRYIDMLEASALSRDEHRPGTTTSYTLAPGPTLVSSETRTVEKTPREGYDISFQIPIYDFGEAKTRLAEQNYLRAVNLLINKAVNVRADARIAYQTYRGAYDIARYYEKEVIPLRDTISEQTLLNYNGMLSDLFGLLTDARERIAANMQSIDAKRDFWLADVELRAAVMGGGSAGVDFALAPSQTQGN
jgi:outer membrane protein TolC